MGSRVSPTNPCEIKIQGSLIFPAISELLKGVVVVVMLDVVELVVVVLDDLFEFPVESEDLGLVD